MNQVPAEKFLKIGFLSKVSALEFIRSNSLRKSKNESIPAFLKRVKAKRVEYNKFQRDQRKQNPVYGPKRRPPNWRYTQASISSPNQIASVVYKKAVSAPETTNIYYKKVSSKPQVVSLSQEHTPIQNNIELRLANESYELKGKLLDVSYDAFIKGDSQKGVPLSESRFNMIYEACNEKFIMRMNEIKEKRNLNNVDTWAQIIYCDHAKQSSHVFNNSFDQSEVIAKLYEKYLHFAENIDYQFFFWGFRIIFRVASSSGGCLHDQTTTSKILPTEDKDISIHIRTYKSENENCLFACLNKQYDVKGGRGSKFEADKLRRGLNIPLKTKISYNQIPQIIDEYNNLTGLNKGFVLFNETRTLLSSYNVPSKNPIESLYGKFDESIIPLYLLNDHYWVFKVVNKIACPMCFKKLREDNTTHECNIKVVEFTAKHLKLPLKKAFGNEWFKKNTCITQKGEYLIRFDNLSDEDKLKAKRIIENSKVVVPYKGKKDKKPKIILHFDFETRLIENNKHDIYAVGYTFDTSKDDQWNYIYFEKNEEPVVNQFVNYLKNLSDNNKDSEIIINAFNGAGYDIHLLLECVSKQEWASKLNYVESNRRIIILKFLNISVFDVCAFVNSSLKKACDDFKVSDKNGKKEFKHEKMVTDDDLITHKDECLSYLKNDVLGLKELTKIVHDTMYERSGLSIYDFITLSHMAYSQWTTFLNNIVIEVPSYEKWEKYIRPATFGGRCNPFRKTYQSKWYDDVMKMKDEIESTYCEELKNLKKLIKEAPTKKIEKQLKEERAKIFSSMIPLYKKIREDGDFIFNSDVTSLYPSAMSGYSKNTKLTLPSLNIKYNNKFEVNKVYFPTGYSIEIENNRSECEKAFESGKLGFYEISYICPKNIIIPILPKRKFIGNKGVGVIFDLVDGKSYFTSVDIENAITTGYKIVFTGNALIYETKCSETFSNYVERYKSLKMSAEKDGNDALRSMAKLMLNALYGKTLQRPIVSDTSIISTIEEFDEFVKLNNITDFHKLNGSSKYIITGDKKEKNLCMTKPCQMGSFVTSYSRRIMLFYMLQMDITLSKFTFTYTDTDSLHVYGEYAKVLEDNGFLVEKKNSDFGYLCSDIDDEGIILKEINLGPKSYMYIYLTSKGEVGIVMKTKGIPKGYLEREGIDIFLNEETKIIKFDNPDIPCFRKTGTKPNSKQLQKGLEEFSVYTVTDMSRTFLKTPWSRYKLEDNSFYPEGYEAYTYPIEIDDEEE